MGGPCIPYKYILLTFFFDVCVVLHKTVIFQEGVLASMGIFDSIDDFPAPLSHPSRHTESYILM